MHDASALSLLAGNILACAEHVEGPDSSQLTLTNSRTYQWS